MINFNVASLMHRASGVRERHACDAVVESFKIHCDVQFLTLPHEINVQIKNLHTVAECRCSRCLKPFSCDIDVPMAERQFIVDLSEREIEPGEDVFYVTPSHEIILDEMIHQEILLHFPPVPVCSESCKGLCDKCGVNLNEKTCSCRHEKEAHIHPFKLPI